MTTVISRCAILSAAVALLSSCSFFQRPAPLPRHAAIESSSSDSQFDALVQGADIIYFPSESAVFNSRSDTTWKLFEALRRNGGSFAVGWDLSGDEKGAREFVTETDKAGAELLSLRAPPQLAEQFAADKIADWSREHRNDKIVVFLRRERLGRDAGVPYFVAQKTKARQLILNPRRQSTGPGLLAGNRGSWIGGRFEIVDRAPFATGDKR